MKTQAPAATSTTVAANLPAYTGPLGRFLAKQAEVKQAAEQAAQQQATLRAMRYHITELVAEPGLFTDAERLRTNDSVYQCDCVAQLQRWFRNVYRVYKERQTALPLAFVDGTRVFLPVAEPMAVVGFSLLLPA